MSDLHDYQQDDRVRWLTDQTMHSDSVQDIVWQLHSATSHWAKLAIGEPDTLDEMCDLEAAAAVMAGLMVKACDLASQTTDTRGDCRTAAMETSPASRPLPPQVKAEWHQEAVNEAVRVALSQLILMQEGAAPDCNAELWDVFGRVGGDHKKLRQVITQTHLIRSWDRDEEGGAA